MKNTITFLGVTVFVVAIAVMTGCASEALNAKPVQWYEETWDHEDGELRLIISGCNWILIKNGVNDEKGTITFNEDSQTFLMKSTHFWDKNTQHWEEHNQKLTGSYSVSGNTWMVNHHVWADFNGKWYGASKK
jgi:hypothetical protein